MSDWIQAERHAERAHRLSKAGQWDRALAELQKALNVIPDQTDWLMSLAAALDALERYDEAATAYERVLRIRGENVDTLVALGIDLVRSGRPERAVATFERVSELDPACEAGYCHRIAAYAQMGEHEQAEVMFYLARQVKEECPICFDYLAQSMSLKGDLTRAVWCWQQTLRLSPGLPGVAGSLARAYWQMDQPELADHYFRQELASHPNDTDAMLASGVLLMEMGKHAEAGERLRAALEVDGTLVDGHLYLAELALLAGHLEAAETRYERARQIDPSRPGAEAGLAQVALLRGDRERAQQHLRAELAVAPDDAEASRTQGQAINLGRMLIEADMPGEALDVLDGLVEDAERRPESNGHVLPDALLCRGASLIMLGDVEAGVRDTRRAVALDPDNPIGLHNLALAYLEAGRPLRAASLIRRALRLRPDEHALHRTQTRVRRRLLGMRLRRWLSIFPPRRSGR